MKNRNVVFSIIVFLGMVSQSAFGFSMCRQFYRDSLKQATFIMNTENLLAYVERGGAARAGISGFWSSRLALNEILSMRGPLGPLGAAGEYGMIGDNPWNPSLWWTHFFARTAWKSFGNNRVKENGPLGKYGVLSDIGPLAQDWGEGAYSIFGTTGILGPLGPLGALGIMGALQSRGLKGPDANGNYYYGGRIAKSIELEWADGTREFEIVEKYTSQEANRRSKNGSLENSYLVDASLNPFESAKSYRSKSDREKVVSVLVIPDLGVVNNAFGFPMQSNFDIEVRDNSGRLIGESKKLVHANFVQFAVPKDGEYEVTIKRQGYSVLPVGYRLISVGVGAEFFESFPNITASSRNVNLYAAISNYSERLKEKTSEVKVKR